MLDRPSHSKEIPIKPPLSSIIDFEKVDRERSHHAKEVEFDSVEEFQDLLRAFAAASDYIKTSRDRYGLSKEEFDPDSVHLVSVDNWGRLGELLPEVKAATAFHEPTQDVVYVQFDSEAYNLSKLGRLRHTYMLVHEMIHTAQRGVPYYSYHLSEGLVDFASQEIMEQRILPQVFNEQEYLYRQGYVARNAPTVERLPLRPEDIVVLDGRGGFSYSRIHEMRLVEGMRNIITAQNFDGLLKFAFAGNANQVKAAVSMLYGEYFAGLIEGTRPDVQKLHMARQFIRGII